MLGSGLCIYVVHGPRRELRHQDLLQHPENLYLGDRGWLELSKAVPAVSKDPLQPPVGRLDCTIDVKFIAEWGWGGRPHMTESRVLSEIPSRWLDCSGIARQ